MLNRQRQAKTHALLRLSGSPLRSFSLIAADDSVFDFRHSPHPVCQDTRLHTIGIVQAELAL
jgi:hypothetical protein